MSDVDAYIGFRDSDGNPSDPLPCQRQAIGLRREKKHILLAGSFGTGKTEWLCEEAVSDAVQFPGNEILMGRKKLDWFRTSTLPILLDAIPPALLLRHDKQNHIIEIKTSAKPSKIYYRQLDSSRDALNQIKSMNLGLFAPDQVEELDEEVFNAASGRLRKIGTPRQSISSCNPAGHNFVWKQWIDKRGGEGYGYVESRMWAKDCPAPICQKDVNFATSDNPYLPWDYIASLLNDYPDHWLDRYVYCGWDNFEGLVYPMWDREIHVVKPFPLMDWWNRYVSLDHGHRNPTAVGWEAVDGDGNIYLYDSYYKAGEWPEYHAELIKAKSDRNGTYLEEATMIADPSIFSKQTEDPISEQYEEHGIYWEAANNDVSGGITRLASYLKLDPKLQSEKYPRGRPKFYVFDIPENRPFIEEIGEYAWDDMSVRSYDKNRPERPKKKNDHHMDRERYVINWIVDSNKPHSERPIPNFVQKHSNTWMSG